MKRVLTSKKEQFICDNYLKMSQQEMADKLRVQKGTVNSCMRRFGLKVPKELACARRSAAMLKKHKLRHDKPQKGDCFLRRNYLKMPVKTMATKINRSHTYVNRRLKELNLIIPREIIERNRKSTMFREGQAPPNKGKKLTDFMTPEGIERSKKYRFKKGSLPHNTKQDGAISIRKESGTDISYKYIRISKAVWELYHRVVWERAHGPIPEGYIVVFKDGDQMNCELSNLKMITQAEHMKNHSASINLTDGYVVTQIAGSKYRGDAKMKAIIATQPELIELKRNQLKLKRAIKQATDDTRDVHGTV